MQFDVAAARHLVDIFKLNKGEEVEGRAHGRPFESDLAKCEEAGYGFREPLLLEPVASEFVVANRGWGSHTAAWGRVTGCLIDEIEEMSKDVTYRGLSFEKLA